jgi:hypothetical protein
MNELWLPEYIIALFLGLHVMRPLIKGLWNLDGLVWLPLLALGLTIGLFFAYGFRPECIPLLVFEIILNMTNRSAIVFSAEAKQNEEFRYRNPLCAVLELAVLGAVVLFMAVFSPKVLPGLTTEGVRVQKIRDEVRGRDYFLRIYLPDTAALAAGGAPGGGKTARGRRPLIFLTPPEAGSIPAVDRICAALGERGFAVISYSRRGFDFPAVGENGRKYLVSPAKAGAMWRAFRAGTSLKSANEQGTALETERLEDIEFLLPRVLALAESIPETEGQTPLILAGYGAGGSALALLAASPGFTGRFGTVRGIVAVESRLWSAYRSDPPVFPEVPAGAPWHRRFAAAAGCRFKALKARRVTGIGPVPRPGVPLLCLVSSGARAFPGGKAGENPYQALLETARNTPGTATLTVIAGAGPLDYYDYPLSQPFYSFLFQGQDGSLPASIHTDTVSVIANFAAALTEGGAVPGLILPAQRDLSAPARVETWGKQ